MAREREGEVDREDKIPGTNEKRPLIVRFWGVPKNLGPQLTA